jgi:HK97 gp10 family phage protein
MSGGRVELKIENGEDLLKALRELSANVEKSVVGATRAGGKVMRDSARSRAKAMTSRSGKITEEGEGGKKKTVQAASPVQLKVRRRKGFAVASVTPAKGYGHLRLLEYGAQPHTIYGKPWLRFFSGGQLIEVRAVRHPGFAARPWLRPAIDAIATKAIEAVGESLAETLEKARIEAEGSDD